MIWHTLLAPLPPEATPTERPLASPEILATAEGASIAGWTQLAVHLSAGCDGLRVVLVVIDESGLPLSANDAVLYRREDAADEVSGRSGRVHYCHETVGGRFEPDGRFRGQLWVMESTETEDGVDEASRRATHRDPTPEEVEALKALVNDVMRRAGGRK
jgi:hypothetical protein